MYSKLPFHFFLTLLLVVSCNAQKQDKVVIKPLEALSLIDEHLSNVSDPIQVLTAPTSKNKEVRGKNGTRIFVKPVDLETVDGSKLDAEIQVELLEMVDKKSLLANNAPTTADSKLLVTGGAYFINMTSNGKPLKLKKGKTLEVQFPKLSDNEMALFLGERNDKGEINWTSTQMKLDNKSMKSPVKPTAVLPKSSSESTDTLSDLDKIFDYVENGNKPKEVKQDEVSKEEYEQFLKEMEAYNQELKRQKFERKTYSSVQLNNFGWINCDRFLNDPNPTFDLPILFERDSLYSARFYAIFQSINSVVATSYYPDVSTDTQFYSLPEGYQIKIIGIGIQDDDVLFFEKDINTSKTKQVFAEFQQIPQNELEKKLQKLDL